MEAVLSNFTVREVEEQSLGRLLHQLHEAINQRDSMQKFNRGIGIFKLDPIRFEEDSRYSQEERDAISLFVKLHPNDQVRFQRTDFWFVKEKIARLKRSVEKAKCLKNKEYFSVSLSRSITLVTSQDYVGVNLNSDVDTTVDRILTMFGFFQIGEDRCFRQPSDPAGQVKLARALKELRKLKYLDDALN